jgi:hypothetical protein
MAKIRLLIVLSGICLTIQACATEAAQDTHTTVAPDLGNSSPVSTSQATVQPIGVTPTTIPSPTSIDAVEPSYTPTTQPSPTPYPTYDPNKQPVRPTPPREVCRKPDPSYAPRFTLAFEQGPEAISSSIVEDLNSGASYDQLISAVPAGSDNPIYFEDPLVQDLTGDGVNELAVRSLADTFIFGCLDGEYRLLHDEASSGSAPSLLFTSDMNLDGIPDLVFAGQVTSGPMTVVNIVEWDGSSFVPLIQACHGDNARKTSALARQLYWYQTNWLPREPGQCFPYPYVDGVAEVQLRDLDGNGTQELVITDHGPSSFDSLYNFGPWRGKTTVFEWDGFHFLYSSLTIDRPDYRFQALQDADREFLLGNYDQALSLYQDVVFSDKLEWWTPERIRYPIDAREAEAFNTPAPATPQPDPSEYKALAAYARYRIVLNHIARGWTTPAQTVLEGLHSAFSGDVIGAPYVQAADLLWTSFQESQDLASACGHVVEYFDQHPELLEPLGNSSHGQQSHVYAPEDTCPVR